MHIFRVIIKRERSAELTIMLAECIIRSQRSSAAKAGRHQCIFRDKAISPMDVTRTYEAVRLYAVYYFKVSRLLDGTCFLDPLK